MLLDLRSVQGTMDDITLADGSDDMNETVIKISPKEIVTVCRNCGANLNGKAKCEYCGTVYPENMFYLEQQEDTEARKRADALLACGLFHTELSEINDDIKHIQAEIDKMR